MLKIQQKKIAQVESLTSERKQLKEKLKTDRLLYKATALDESATPSAEQSINDGSRSSDNKDNASDSEKQRKSQNKQYPNKSHKKKNILY